MFAQPYSLSVLVPLLDAAYLTLFLVSTVDSSRVKCLDRVYCESSFLAMCLEPFLIDPTPNKTHNMMIPEVTSVALEYEP